MPAKRAAAEGSEPNRPQTSPVAAIAADSGDAAAAAAAKRDDDGADANDDPAASEEEQLRQLHRQQLQQMEAVIDCLVAAEIADDKAERAVVRDEAWDWTWNLNQREIDELAEAFLFMTETAADNAAATAAASAPPPPPSVPEPKKGGKKPPPSRNAAPPPLVEPPPPKPAQPPGQWLEEIELGRCLRAIGQNPSECEIALMLCAARMPPKEDAAPGGDRPPDAGLEKPEPVSNKTDSPNAKRAAGDRKNSPDRKATASSPGKEKKGSSNTKYAKPTSSATAGGGGGRGKKAQNVTSPTTKTPMPPPAPVDPSTIEDIDGYLSMRQFLRGTAAVMTGGLLAEDDMGNDLVTAFQVFDDYDDDDDGYIDADALACALRSYGEPLGDDDVDEMFRLVDDLRCDGKFNYLRLAQKLVCLIPPPKPAPEPAKDDEKSGAEADAVRNHKSPKPSAQKPPSKSAGKQSSLK